MYKLIDKLVVYVILSFFAVLSLFPFYWMVITALKRGKDAFLYPPQWVPNPIIFENFTRVWKEVDFSTHLFNTAFITVLIVVSQLIFSSMAAYGFARMDFPGKDMIFLVFLGGLMIPSVVTMIPLYLLIKWLGWINSYKALIVPSMFGTAFGVFFLRQYFMTISKELEEASRIDGAGIIRTFVTIILPISKSPIATLGILSFVGSWNNFLWPLIVINSNEKQVISVALANLQGQYTSDWTGIMAGSLLTLLPILILFFAVQKFFVESIQISGFK